MSLSIWCSASISIWTMFSVQWNEGSRLYCKNICAINRFFRLNQHFWTMFVHRIVELFEVTHFHNHQCHCYNHHWKSLFLNSRTFTSFAQCTNNAHFTEHRQLWISTLQIILSVNYFFFVGRCLYERLC